jgi:hypothetical protein
MCIMDEKILKALVWVSYIASQAAGLSVVPSFRSNPYSMLHILYGVCLSILSLQWPKETSACGSSLKLLSFLSDAKET